SIVMPRAFSSGNRSVSVPVSAFTSDVLPWSMWPAVPTTTCFTAALPRRSAGPPATGQGGLPASYPFRCGQTLGRREMLGGTADGGGQSGNLACKDGTAVEVEPIVEHPADDRRLPDAQRGVEFSGPSRSRTEQDPGRGKLDGGQGASADLGMV